MANRFSSEIVAVITALDWDTEPSVTTLRVALYGGVYTDTENISGPKVHYNGRIKSDVMLDKRIGVAFWNEDSDIDFGFLDIAIEDQNAELVEFAAKTTIATVDIYRVNLNDPDATQLNLATSSRSSDIGFVNENTIRFRLESTLQGGFDAPINELYYDNAYPTLDGKPYPIAWGLIKDPQQLLPTVFVYADQLLYHVTDLEIASFESKVYDRGIALTETTNFIAVDHGFTLEQNPDGKITCGQLELVDPEDIANTFNGLLRFVRLAMTRGGIWANANETELGTLESSINLGNIYPEYFALDVVALETFMDEVFAGTGSWYYVDELAEVHFGRLTDPDDETPALAFTDANVIGDISVDDDKAPGLSTRITHAASTGVYTQDELAGGVTNANRILMTNDGYTRATTEPVIDFYAKATTREPIALKMSFSAESWRADSTVPKADSTVYTADSTTSSAMAQSEVDRWWAELYPVRRRFYTFTVMLNDPLFDSAPLPHLGDFCTLQSDLSELLETAKNLLIRGLKFNYSQNQLTVEGWG